MIERMIERRIERGIGLRRLSRATGIVIGALEEAERLGSLDNFTVAQIRRLDSVLGLEMLSGMTADSDNGEPRGGDDEELSDAALGLLVGMARDELETGAWSELANGAEPTQEAAELLAAGAIEVRDGRARVSSDVMRSMSLILREGQATRREIRFSTEVVSTMARTLDKRG